MLIIILAMLFATPAYAGVFGKIGGWFSWEVAAIVLSAVVALIAGAATVMFTKITRTLKEAGEFLVVFGNALEDKKTTPDELKAILKEGRDVLDIWKKTPERYQAPNG